MRRYESIGGFYKGLGAYLLHVTPNVCIVFLLYENLSANPILVSEADATDQHHHQQLPIPSRRIVREITNVVDEIS